MKSHKAFTLIELLVVVGIISILIAILLPQLGKVKRKAKAAQCLANLHGFGQATQSYITDWGRSFSGGDQTTTSWMQLLQNGGKTGAAGTVAESGGYGGSAKLRTCPEAREMLDPRSTALQVGTAHHQWGNAVFGGVNVNGSYAINGFIYSYPDSDANFITLWAGTSGNTAAYYFRIPSPSNVESRTPAYADATWRHVFPQPADAPPLNLETPTTVGDNAVINSQASPSNPQMSTNPNPMARMVINRHDRAVNVAFLDGHAETVKLPDLWTLRWNLKWTTRKVTINYK